MELVVDYRAPVVYSRAFLVNINHDNTNTMVSKITHEILKEKGFSQDEYGNWLRDVSPDTDLHLTEGIDNSYYPSIHQAPEMGHQDWQMVALPFIETTQQLDNLLSVLEQ